MVGLIGFVQIVHYPLFAAVPAGEPFAGYHREHVRRTTWVVAPVMLVELITSVALLLARPAYVATWLAWAGLGVLAIAWLSTALLQVPRHNELARCYADSSYGALCRTNWIRTIAWTARGALLMYAAAAAVG
jgi:hypothetical protein